MAEQSYQGILDFVRENKDSLIEEMKIKVASQFMASLNSTDSDDNKLLADIKIEERALERTSELIENVLEKLEKGGTS